MLNSCDECKHHGLTMDDVENEETNENDSDSDFETNMVKILPVEEGWWWLSHQVGDRGWCPWSLGFVAVNGGNAEGAHSL